LFEKKKLVLKKLKRGKENKRKKRKGRRRKDCFIIFDSILLFLLHSFIPFLSLPLQTTQETDRKSVV